MKNRVIDGHNFYEEQSSYCESEKLHILILDGMNFIILITASKRQKRKCVRGPQCQIWAYPPTVSRPINMKNKTNRLNRLVQQQEKRMRVELPKKLTKKWNSKRRALAFPFTVKVKFFSHSQTQLLLQFQFNS